MLLARALGAGLGTVAYTRPWQFLRGFCFELTGEQLAAIDALDTGKRGGPEPADVTLATFGMPIPEA